MSASPPWYRIRAWWAGRRSRGSMGVAEEHLGREKHLSASVARTSTFVNDDTDDEHEHCDDTHARGRQIERKKNQKAARRWGGDADRGSRRGPPNISLRDRTMDHTKFHYRRDWFRKTAVIHSYLYHRSDIFVFSCYLPP